MSSNELTTQPGSEPTITPETAQTLPQNVGRFYKQFSKSTVFASNDNLGNNCFILCNDCLPLLHPFGPFSYFWDIFIMLILLYTCIEAPVSLAFEIELQLVSIHGIIALFVDISLFIDVLINFRTAYFDNTDALKLIIDPRSIAIKYLKSWFIIDVATCIPFQLFYNQQAFGYEVLFMLRLFKSLRIIKILRFLKMVHVFDTFVKQFGREIKAFIKLSKLIFFMLLFAHFAACVWWFVGQHSTHEQTWIDAQNVQLNNDFKGYSYAWYWAIVTLFTTGYGDIVATNTTEQWVSSICIIIGTIFFSYFIGTLTVLITEGDKDRSFELAKLEEASSFCRMKKLPQELTRAILTHIRYHCQYNYVHNDKDLLDSLPPYLQSDIHKYLSHRMLSQIDIFKSLNKSILGQIALKMRSVSCNEDYELFKAGERAKEIYIQRTGVSTLKFHDNRNQTIHQLKRGHVFGEYALISPKRKVSVECVTWSEFYILNVSDVLTVLETEYPSSWRNKWKKMRAVVEQHNYVTNKQFNMRRVKYKKHNKILSDHHIHHQEPTVTTESNEHIAASSDDNNANDILLEDNPLTLNRALSHFLHAPSTVKTARFHGKKSVQTEWDGSIPATFPVVKSARSTDTMDKIVEVCEPEENQDEEYDVNKAGSMSTIKEHKSLGSKAMKLDEEHLADFQRGRSQSVPSSSVGILQKALFFKKNSSIRNYTISSAHKKKMSSLTLSDLRANEEKENKPIAIEMFNPEHFANYKFYFADSVNGLVHDSEDDEGDIFPGLQGDFYPQSQQSVVQQLSGAESHFANLLRSESTDVFVKDGRKNVGAKKVEKKQDQKEHEFTLKIPKPKVKNENESDVSSAADHDV